MIIHQIHSAVTRYKLFAFFVGPSMVSFIKNSILLIILFLVVGVRWAAEAAPGAQWFYYDADGDLDLYITNGLLTGPEDQDISNLFVRTYSSKEFLLVLWTLTQSL